MRITTDRRGFALLATLWVLALLSGVAVTMLAVARTERRAVLNARDEAHARWARTAALAAALDMLGDGTTEHSAAVLARRDEAAAAILELRVNGLDVRVTLEDTRSRVNVNLADSLTLRRLFELAGLTPAQAIARTAALLDARDADGERRPYGAEAAEYAAHRPPRRPRDAPFEAAADLREVLGFDPGLVAQLAGWVGTTGDGLINVNTAPLEVLATLPGVTVRGAAELLIRRRARPFETTGQILAALPAEEAVRAAETFDALQARVAFAPRELALRIVARRADGVLSQSRVDVRLAGGTILEIMRVVEE